MIPKVRKRRTAAVAALMAAALAGTALGQHQVSDGEFVLDPESIEAMDLLSRRDRESIHPGNPLSVVGLGEGGNDFRAGLHAARRGSYVPTQVDDRELHERQLAMYEGRQSFDGAPRRIETPGGDAKAAPRAVEREAPEPEPYDTAWIGMLVAAMASVGAFLTKGRGTPGA